jgi:hypothetical protein
MSLDMDQIAEAFCSHRFAVTYPYMAEEIKWNTVGIEEAIGREAVIERCNRSAKFLETVSSRITKLEIHRAETFVVVEGAAQFRDQANQKVHDLTPNSHQSDTINHFTFLPFGL